MKALYSHEPKQDQAQVCLMRDNLHVVLRNATAKDIKPDINGPTFSENAVRNQARKQLSI